MKQLHMFVSGSVQGVCFRAYVQEKADMLGLAGYARNLADGRVEVLAEGPEKALQTLLGFVKQGPALAQVSQIEETWGEAQNKWKGFGINE